MMVFRSDAFGYIAYISFLKPPPPPLYILCDNAVNLDATIRISLRDWIWMQEVRGNQNCIYIFHIDISQILFLGRAERRIWKYDQYAFQIFHQKWCRFLFPCYFWILDVFLCILWNKLSVSRYKALTETILMIIHF